MRSVLAQLPTGGGKTVLFSSISYDVLAKGHRIIILVHRKELVLQTLRSLQRYGITAEVIMPGYRYCPTAQINVAMVQTISRRDAPMNVGFIITDEAHHAKATSYKSVYEQYPDARHLGVSATPCRADGKGLSDIFQEMVRGPSVKELIALGSLVQPRVLANPLKFDLSKLKTSRGDYNEAELFALMNQNALIGNLVRTWQTKAEGRKTVCFAVNVHHSKHIVETYKNAGVRAAHLDGETPDAVRDTLLRDFAAGQIDVLSNVNVISEGFDVPAIECVQFARPTQSLAMYLQQGGRALRPFEGKSGALILDHADNTFKHGFLEQDREWSLAGVKKHAEWVEIKVMDKKTRKTYAPQDLPNTIEDFELIEVKHENYRARRMESELLRSVEAEEKPMAAWNRFVRSVGGRPTMQEIDRFQKAAGFKSGWAYHTKVQLGYISPVSPFQRRATA
jgi:superfamily II DNA or RNA helicase